MKTENKGIKAKIYASEARWLLFQVKLIYETIIKHKNRLINSVPFEIKSVYLNFSIYHVDIMENCQES